jgi:phosphatidylinositol alpha-mannosyltransferase
MSRQSRASLRIAVTSLYLPGSSKIGVGHQVHAFANRLVDRGHSVTVFSSGRPGSDARYEYEHVDPGGSPRSFRFAWRLRSVDFSRFDVLHAHGDDCFLAGIPRPYHVRTVHGSCFSEAKHVKGAKEKLRMVLLGVGEVVSMVLADDVVAVSNATRRWYPWIKRVIPCGVDIQRFAPSIGVERSVEPSVLFVGTYENRKRGRLLADTFVENVLPVRPGARLLMVCEDAPSCLGVEVVGRVSDARLAELYREAWLFCLPSSYEGFGVPYIEAMAAECPVLATPNPGALEVLGRGEFGVIVDPAELGLAILDLLDDPQRRETMAERARQHVDQYDWSRVVESYERLYPSPAGDRNGTSSG